MILLNLKEIPGATLVVKDKTGKTLYNWISTTEVKKKLF